MSMHLLYIWTSILKTGILLLRLFLSKQIRDKIYGHSLYILYNIWSKTLLYDTRLGNLPIFL